MTEQHRITGLKAREVIDCRGTPTIEVDMWVDNTLRGRADVPSGRSVGSYEACELRDGGSRYDGLGVLKAVRNVNEIVSREVIGLDVTQQRKLDSLLIDLDGSRNKSKLGANALLGVSLAAARAAASSLGIPLYKYINANAYVLPVPMINLVNGGELASNDLDFQEFIIMPVGAETFSQALQIAAEVNSKLRALLIKKYGKIAINVGDEGGCVPPITSIREALDVLQEAVRQTVWEDKIVYALDVAASHLYNKNTKKYTVEGKQLSSKELIDLFKDLVSQYPIVSIEDPLDEDDFDTNSERLRRGIEMGAANALLWKVNQIGTLSEAFDSAVLALRNGYSVVVSERSGETEDSIIADFAVGLNAGQIKTGAPVRSERTCKYNQLLRIEEELGSSAKYAGRSFRQPL